MKNLACFLENYRNFLATIFQNETLEKRAPEQREVVMRWETENRRNR